MTLARFLDAHVAEMRRWLAERVEAEPALSKRAKLREVTRFKDYAVKAERAGGEEKADLKVNFWRLKLGDEWTVPAVELVRGEPKATAVLVSDAGRAKSADAVRRLLDEGQRLLHLCGSHGQATR